MHGELEKIYRDSMYEEMRSLRRKILSRKYKVSDLYRYNDLINKLGIKRDVILEWAKRNRPIRELDVSDSIYKKLELTEKSAKQQKLARERAMELWRIKNLHHA